MKQILDAKRKNDYATVKVLMPKIHDELVVQELEGWLKEFMVYDRQSELEIAKRIGYMGDTDILSQKGIDKIKEICEVPMVLRITGPHIEDQTKVESVMVEEEECYNVVAEDGLSRSMIGIQSELENMNKINLLSLRQQSLQHSYELEQRNRELQVMREMVQFSSIEKTRRKLQKRNNYNNNKKWVGLVMVVCTLQFFIPLLLKIASRPPAEEMCLIPSINLGMFTLIEKKGLCFSLPDRLGLSMMMWSAFAFCRFFDITTLQPILFLAAMWCTDLHLVVSCILLQASWIIGLYVAKETYEKFYEHFAKISLCVIATSCLTSYFLQSHIYELINFYI